MDKINIFKEMNDEQLAKAFKETIDELKKNKDEGFRIGLKKRVDRIKKKILFDWIEKNLDEDTIKNLRSNK